MSKEKSTTSGGIGISSAMFLIFLTLKLVGIEPISSWSWWWVTAPLWGTVLFAISIFAIVAMVLAGAETIDRRKKWKRFLREDR